MGNIAGILRLIKPGASILIRNTTRLLRRRRLRFDIVPQFRTICHIEFSTGPLLAILQQIDHARNAELIQNFSPGQNVTRAHNRIAQTRLSMSAFCHHLAKILGHRILAIRPFGMQFIHRVISTRNTFAIIGKHARRTGINIAFEPVSSTFTRACNLKIDLIIEFKMRTDEIGRVNHSIHALDSIFNIR